jgi:ribosomal protein S18 acetylase RimI-like enzyme
MTLSGALRPLNPLRDLMAVADLIELCFHGSMDAEGRSFLNDLRRPSRGSSLADWAARTSDLAGMPLSGFVWEDSGQIVGNVSIIPFTRRGIRVMLVANVAVHPDYRRRGIGRHLTQRAMLAARERSSQEIWLQVRDDNPGAIKLYQDLGWRERARRTTWRVAPGQPVEPTSPRLRVYDRAAHDWPAERVVRAELPAADQLVLPVVLGTVPPGIWSSFQAASRRH